MNSIKFLVSNQPLVQRSVFLNADHYLRQRQSEQNFTIANLPSLLASEKELKRMILEQLQGVDGNTPIQFSPEFHNFLHNAGISRFIRKAGLPKLLPEEYIYIKLSTLVHRSEGIYSLDFEKLKSAFAYFANKSEQTKRSDAMDRFHLHNFVGAKKVKEHYKAAGHVQDLFGALYKLLVAKNTNVGLELKMLEPNLLQKLKPIITDPAKPFDGLQVDIVRFFLAQEKLEATKTPSTTLKNIDPV